MTHAHSPLILATGASGFIGRRLMAALLQRGHRVRCMVRRPVDLPAGVQPVPGDLSRQPDPGAAADPLNHL